MTKPRIPETDHGIQGEFTVAIYDEMQRKLRDKGWIETKALLDHGILQGHALEIGHGPGYLGLEWLKHTQDTRLTGVDISPDMIALATRNAHTYGLDGRVQYQLGSGDNLPFDDNQFEAVFSNGSLHEWNTPQGTFNEVWRVVKPGGTYFVSDLRRDMNFLIKWLMWLGTNPAAIRPGLITSINAAYTPQELVNLAKGTKLQNGRTAGNLIGVSITGIKQ
jgi:ubiquinone/menaquinone biosynthesis C-methylase UbiE